MAPERDRIAWRSSRSAATRRRPRRPRRMATCRIPSAVQNEKPVESNKSERFQGKMLDRQVAVPCSAIAARWTCSIIAMADASMNDTAFMSTTRLPPVRSRAKQRCSPRLAALAKSISPASSSTGRLEDGRSTSVVAPPSAVGFKERRWQGLVCCLARPDRRSLPLRTELSGLRVSSRLQRSR